MNQIVLRSHLPSDADVLAGISVAAFSEYANHYSDWPTFSRKISDWSALAASSQVVVAELNGRPVGAVAYVSPTQPKLPFFEPHWATMRMLVVHPEARGHGIGRTLAHECLKRAEQDAAETFALHTSEVMSVALAMYLRMGFRFDKAAPDIGGVKYNIYVRPLSSAMQKR